MFCIRTEELHKNLDSMKNGTNENSFKDGKEDSHDADIADTSSPSPTENSFDKVMSSITDPKQFLFEIERQKVEVDFKVKNMMKEGVYSWLNPLSGSKDIDALREANILYWLFKVMQLLREGQ
jgi:hypothetical protein